MKALITLFTLATLAGCATMISQTPIPPCEAKSCFTEMKGSVDAGGGGRYDKLIEAGSFVKAREKGWVRTEGKEYIVKDGDVIEFLI